MLTLLSEASVTNYDRLKSASANPGTSRLTCRCSESEALARGGHMAQALAPLGIVEFAFEAECNAVKTYLQAT